MSLINPLWAVYAAEATLGYLGSQQKGWNKRRERNMGEKGKGEREGEKSNGRVGSALSIRESKPDA